MSTSCDELEAQIADYEDILASPARQRQIIGDELAEIVAKYGDERRTEIIAYDGDVADEDLIAEEDVVVTITHGGYAKRTKTDLYRAQRRGGKGVRGRAAAHRRHRGPLLRHHDPPLDPVLHEQGPGLPRQGLRAARGRPRRPRPARGQPARVPAGRAIAEVLALRDYEVAPYLVLATEAGWSRSPSSPTSTRNRSGGIIAINLREDDEVIAARLVSPEDDLLLVSSKAQADPVPRRPTSRCARWAGPPRA